MAHRDAWTAATRFGLGPRAGEIARVGDDPTAWLEAQLGPAEPTPGLDALPSSGEAIREFARGAKGSEADRRAIRAAHRQTFETECQVWMQTAAASGQPFRERLVAFFANHFTVSTARPEVVGIAGAFVREAIRPHVTGRFADLLRASTRHPAMLVYLDNVRSVGPDSPAGRRSGQGLNENLAREILELHTLGVDGGYVQADVEAFAAILTGWGVARAGRSGPEIAGTFHFEPRRHQPGAKTLLGTRYPEGGEGEGEAALRDLAAQPATARFVCRKLVRHFVADTPPEALVDALVAAWDRTDGDLGEVARTLVRHDAAWSAARTKVRSPLELVLAGARAFGWESEGIAMVTSLRMLGQDLQSAPSPEGWPDTTAEWLGPDALLSRLEWAGLLAEQSLGRVPDVDAFVTDLLGPRMSTATRKALARANAPVARLALAIASPEFQRR